MTEERSRQQCYLTLLLACNCRDVRPFSLYSRQAQQCSFQVPINHFPQSCMVDSFIFRDLRGEGIQFL